MTLESRLSNFELLRCIAMFLVLMVHADFYSLGAPEITNIRDISLGDIVQLLIQGISIVCVNVFVLISGWFGIRPNIKSFANFIFQCSFFSIGIYLVSYFSGISPISGKGILECFYFTIDHWFVKSYIGLYIIAPILNAYITHTSKSQLKQTILYFYLFQTIYAWYFGVLSFVSDGYSTFSFIGLYLLASYVRHYPIRFSYNKWIDISIFFFIIMLELILYATNILKSRIYLYTNPMVILGSVCLLLYFSKLSFVNKWINYIGSSCFAVYLFHMNPNLEQTYFVPMIQWLYNETTGFMTIISIGVFLVLVFCFSILIDQLRKLLWSFLWGKIEVRINRS